MSELEEFLLSVFCHADLVGHIDGCELGAYVITTDEMEKIVSMISKKSAEKILALHEQDRAKVNSQCDTLINMSTVDKYLDSL